MHCTPLVQDLQRHARHTCAALARAPHPARAYGMCLAYGRPTRLAPHGQMHINAATLLNLVQLPLAVASLPTGSIATLGRAPSAPIALHGRKLHQDSVSSVAEPTAAVGDSAVDMILLAFGGVCLWNAVFCFLVFAFWLRGAAVLGRALDRMGNFTPGCAKDRVSRLLLLGASDDDGRRACPLVQKLLMFCLSVPLGVFLGTASVGSFSRWAHSWRSATASRRSDASSTRARLHVRCLIILAGFGSCSAQRSGPPSAPSAPGAMVVSSRTTGPVMTASDVALRGRHLNEVSASTVGEFTAAVSNSAVDKILLGAGTYELTSDMCTKSAVCIDRALTIEAEVPGAVVLNAMGARRVFEIQSGGTAELIGLNITGGYAHVQTARLLNPMQHFLQFPANRTHV